MKVLILSLILIFAHYMDGKETRKQMSDLRKSDPKHSSLQEEAKNLDQSDPAAVQAFLEKHGLPNPIDQAKPGASGPDDVAKMMLEVSSSELPTLADDDYEKALNIHKGKYEQMSFGYQNAQNMYVRIRRPRNQMLVFPNYRCIRRYKKCLVSQSVPTPVCAFNRREDYNIFSFITGNSYCDIYYDNCRRGARVWRIVDHGKCIYGYKGYLGLDYSRRMNGKYTLIRKIMDAIATNNIGKNGVLVNQGTKKVLK